MLQQVNNKFLPTLYRYSECHAYHWLSSGQMIYRAMVLVTFDIVGMNWPDENGTKGQVKPNSWLTFVHLYCVHKPQVYSS